MIAILTGRMLTFAEILTMAVLVAVVIAIVVFVVRQKD
jgi:hypothetical protein